MNRELKIWGDIINYTHARDKYSQVMDNPFFIIYQIPIWILAPMSFMIICGLIATIDTENKKEDGE